MFSLGFLPHLDRRWVLGGRATAWAVGRVRGGGACRGRKASAERCRTGAKSRRGYGPFLSARSARQCIAPGADAIFGYSSRENKRTTTWSRRGRRLGGSKRARWTRRDARRGPGGRGARAMTSVTSGDPGNARCPCCKVRPEAATRVQTEMPRRARFPGKARTLSPRGVPGAALRRILEPNATLTRPRPLPVPTLLPFFPLAAATRPPHRVRVVRARGAPRATQRARLPPAQTRPRASRPLGRARV